MTSHIVVLDATELTADPLLRSRTMRILLEASRREWCLLYVPEVVMVEVVAKHQRDLQA